MLDIGWSELLLIGVVALIVVGPKDLPHMFNALGRFTAKVRSMAREFTSAMEDASRSSGMDDAANSLRDLKSLTSKKSLGLDALDRAADRFEKWQPGKPAPAGKATTGKAAEITDPAAPAPASAEAQAAAPAATAPQPEATAPKPGAPSPDAPQPVADTAADPLSQPDPPARRLRAVRRSDMKDL